jgi:hypothetical protein
VSLISLIGDIIGHNKGAQETCFPCKHFCSDPVRIESALPGLSILSSAHASVTADDGLCLRHDLLINGRRRCPAFDDSK